MAIWDMKWHPAGHLLATGSNDRQTKFWARNRVGSDEGLVAGEGGGSGGGTSGNAGDEEDEESAEILSDEIELGNHVGIVIGKRGATIIAMQRSTGTKMHVDQGRRVLLIEGTAKQIDVVKKRVGALLDRVSSDFASGDSGGGNSSNFSSTTLSTSSRGGSGRSSGGSGDGGAYYGPASY